MGGLRRNPENVADSRNQLARTEGFGDVSVATGVEGLKAVRFLSLGGKKNDGRLAQSFVLADLAAEIEAADPRQHNVEKKQRRVRHGCHGNHRRPGEKRGDLVAGGSQVVLDQARHIGIVFHDVDQIGASAGCPVASKGSMPEREPQRSPKLAYKTCLQRLCLDSPTRTLEGLCCSNVAPVLKES